MPEMIEIDSKDNNSGDKIVIKISQKELSALNLRRDIIANKTIETNLLQRELDSFLFAIQTKYKLDVQKEYIIDKEGSVYFKDKIKK